MEVAYGSSPFADRTAAVPVRDPTVADDALRRSELAAFLRARRRALRPEDVGLVRSARRRVVGLRREEVAHLAFVSVTWYTWLEQERVTRTAVHVLDSLARALQLDEANHRHLRRLGGHPLPPATHRPLREASAGLRALIDEQLPSPAALVRPNGDLVSWNSAVLQLWGDPGVLPAERRNGLVMLTSASSRSRLQDWETHCRAAIASFRAEMGKHLGDPRDANIVAMLNEDSDIFRAAWPEHEVGRRVGSRYVHQHPVAGEISTEYVALRSIGEPDLIVIVHRLADEASRARMWSLLASADGRV